MLEIESDVNEEDNFDLNVRHSILANRINYLHIEHELVRFENKAIRLRLNILKKTIKTLITKKKLQTHISMLQNNLNNDFVDVNNNFAKIRVILNVIDSENNSAKSNSLPQLVNIENAREERQELISNLSNLETLLEKNETYNQNYRDRFMQRNQS